MELNNMEMASNNIVENKQLMRQVLHQDIAMEMTGENVGKLADLVIACQNAALDFQTEKSRIWDEKPMMTSDDPDYNRVIHLTSLSNNASEISDNLLTMMASNLSEEEFESVSQYISDKVDSYAQSKANPSQSNMSHGAK